jgi:hypothetical protein
MRRIPALIGGAMLVLALSGPAAAAGLGPPAGGFYVDDVAYVTIGTPTDLSGTDAPASSFDTLYAVEGQTLAVASSAPGDSDYDGGRWMRFQVTWNVTPYLLTSEEDVLAAADAGDVTIASTPDAQFVCPVIQA